MKRLVPDLSDTNQRNAFFLVFETTWAGVFAVVVSFGSVYAIRLGASNNEVGLLTSIPALLAILISLPLGNLLARRTRPERWTFFSLFMQRASYLLLVAVPFVPLLANNQGTIVVALIILISIPAQIYNIGIWAFYMKIIPTSRWVGIFSSQSFITALVVGIGTALVGSALGLLPFPSNYQTMITVGVFISMASFFCFAQVRAPVKNDDSIEPTEQAEETKVSLRSLIHLKSDYGRVILNQVFQYLGIWTATSLITIYTIKILQAPDSWVGLNTSVLLFCQLAGWIIARRVIKHWGEPAILKNTATFPVFQTLLVGLSPSLTPIMLANGLHGLLHPSYSLSHNNLLLKSIPPGKEHEGIALYTTINRIGMFICPLLGLALVKWVGNIRIVIVACGILSLLGSLAFVIWPVSPNAIKKYETSS
jgi:hypothetical protein